MIRPSTLLPALILAFGLAGTSLAMAQNSSSNNMTTGHATIQLAAETCSNSGPTPDHQECTPPNRLGKRGLGGVTHTGGTHGSAKRA
jgi:hypothetical protein